MKKSLLTRYRILIIRKVDKMKSAVREMIQVGNLILTKVSMKKNTKNKSKRRKKENLTSEEVMKNNEKNSLKDFTVKLHHNFKPGDIHAVFTYSGTEPSKEEANKKLDKLKRDLKKLYQKNNLELKWLEVTEYKNKRIHHHLVLSKIDVYELAKIWPHGFVRPTYLDNTKDWRKLANYLIKETSKTFREPDAFAKRRFHASRTITNPNIKEQEVSIVQVLEPKANKGYYIDQDSVIKSENLFTRKPYIEFVQIANDTPINLRAGKRKKYKKEKLHKPTADEQLGIFEI